MQKIIYILGLFALLGLSSCDENTFQPFVEVNLPPHTPRLVVRADWVTGSDSLAVFISTSRGVLDKTKANYNQVSTYFNGKDSVKNITEYYDTVPNTKVELLRNGQLIGSIPFYGKGYHIAKGLHKIDTVGGTTYTIRVSAPNFETVEASQKTQNRFVILRGDYRKDGAVYSDPSDPFGAPEKGDELSVELQDNGSDENYYAPESDNSNNFGFFNRTNVIILRDTLNQVFRAEGYVKNIDPTAESSILSDRAFNGKNYIWRFLLSSNSTNNGKPTYYFYSNNGGRGFIGSLKKNDRLNLRIVSYPKDYVLYNKSINLLYDSQDNPFFSEPVIVYTNVKNGYGIFTISNVRTIAFKVP